MENSTTDGGSCSAGDAYVSELFNCARTIKVSWDVSAGSILITTDANSVEVFSGGYYSSPGDTTFSVPAGTTLLSFDIVCATGGATYTVIWECIS